MNKLLVPQTLQVITVGSAGKRYTRIPDESRIFDNNPNCRAILSGCAPISDTPSESDVQPHKY